MIEFLGIFWQVIQWMLIIPGCVISFACVITMIDKYDYLVGEYSESQWVCALIIFLIMVAIFVSWFISKF